MMKESKRLYAIEVNGRNTFKTIYAHTEHEAYDRYCNFNPEIDRKSVKVYLPKDKRK